MAKYQVNEMFYSLQGEGRWSGRAAVFVRFSGCNLKCPFCDTDFNEYTLMSEIDILEKIKSLSDVCRFVVLTGGEPTLQIDEELVSMLKKSGYYIAIETNGTHRIPDGVDWVTCSPKSLFVNHGKVVIQHASEVKVVFDGKHEIRDFGIDAQCYYVQPCDVGDKEKNAEILRQTIDFVAKHPKWQLSLQMHKMLNIR